MSGIVGKGFHIFTYFYVLLALNLLFLGDTNRMIAEVGSPLFSLYLCFWDSCLVGIFLQKYCELFAPLRGSCVVLLTKSHIALKWNVCLVGTKQCSSRTPFISNNPFTVRHQNLTIRWMFTEFQSFDVQVLAKTEPRVLSIAFIVKVALAIVCFVSLLFESRPSGIWKRISIT